MNALSLGIASRGHRRGLRSPVCCRVGYERRSDGEGRQWGPHLWDSPLTTCLARALLAPARALPVPGLGSFMLLGLADHLQLALISVSSDSALSLLPPALSLPHYTACWAHFPLRHLHWTGQPVRGGIWGCPGGPAHKGFNLGGVWCFPGGPGSCGCSPKPDIDIVGSL